jgi:hypothetical protein
MAIENQHMKTVCFPDGFIPFQPGIDTMDEITDRIKPNLRKSSSHGIGTGKLPSQPLSPEPAVLRLFQGIQRTHLS